jgi:HK97 family phage prohead protease
MPYFISDKQSDCSGWAAVKEESDGSYTTIGCHDNKQDAIDQMVAVSISEDMEPGGEVRQISEVPQFIRNNAQRGLDYLAEGYGGDGLTDATKREAREMAAGRISENKVRKMAPWFARHKVDGQAPKNSDPSDPQYPGAGLVAWLLWGGNSNYDDAAQNWAQRQIDKLNNENKKARSKMRKSERRTFTVRNIEARQADDGTMRLAGYAAVFNEPSLPLPFIEKIMPGAFRKTLSETPDVRLLINHEGLPLARTKNGTMRLYEDNKGLYFEANLADTTEARDLYTLVARGDVDQMSFAFRVIRQKWNMDKTERTLSEVSLADGDVSIVTYPAYPATSVEAREALKKAIAQIKEGREITGDSLLVLQNIFGDLEEGHEYIMKAVEVMSALLGNGEMEEDSMDEDDEDYTDGTPEENLSLRQTVGEYVSWDSAGGTARGRIVEIKMEGSINVPGSDFTINAEEGDPAVLIRVYEEYNSGWRATDTLVGHKMSELRVIDPLPKPSEEAQNITMTQDGPGKGTVVIGDLPVMGDFPVNKPNAQTLPLRMSLRLARAKANRIK